MVESGLGGTGQPRQRGRVSAEARGWTEHSGSLRGTVRAPPPGPVTGIQSLQPSRAATAGTSAFPAWRAERRAHGRAVRDTDGHLLPHQLKARLGEVTSQARSTARGRAVSSRTPGRNGQPNVHCAHLRHPSWCPLSGRTRSPVGWFVLMQPVPPKGRKHVFSHGMKSASERTWAVSVGGAGAPTG